MTPADTPAPKAELAPESKRTFGTWELSTKSTYFKSLAMRLGTGLLILFIWQVLSLLDSVWPDLPWSALLVVIWALWHDTRRHLRRKLRDRIQPRVGAPRFAELRIIQQNTVTGWDRGHIYFEGGLLGFQGERTSFALSRYDVASYWSPMHRWRRFFLSAQRSTLRLRFSIDGCDYAAYLQVEGDEHQLTQTKGEFEKWQREDPQTRPTSVLPPIQVDPSTRYRAAEQRVLAMLAILCAWIIAPIYYLVGPFRDSATHFVLLMLLSTFLTWAAFHILRRVHLEASALRQIAAKHGVPPSSGIDGVRPVSLLGSRDHDLTANVILERERRFSSAASLGLRHTAKSPRMRPSVLAADPDIEAFRRGTKHEQALQTTESPCTIRYSHAVAARGSNRERNA